MPASVRVSVIVMSILAGLLLLNAGLTFYGRDNLADALVEAGQGISRDEAMRFILLWMLPYLVLGGMLAVAAWFLPRRQPWARWLGLAASTMLGMLTLLSMIAAGGITIPSLLLVILATAAITSLLSRTTAAWVPRLRSRG
jgi:hypothetical protein